MEHETMSKLFLELSQVLPEGTKTARELRLEAKNAELREALELFLETFDNGHRVGNAPRYRVCEKARAALKESE